MRLQSFGTFGQGVADVDPVAAPLTILTNHFYSFKKTITRVPTKLILALLGASAETLTVSLYTLAEHLDEGTIPSGYVLADTRWYSFATGIIVTNGVLQTVTSGLPAGGTVYVRRTADTIGSGLTRQLALSWM
jgi:hypothetical protein